MSINCHHCGKPAMFQVGPSENQIPLCLDCHLKYNQSLALQRDALERELNHAYDQAEHIAGVRGLMPRYPERHIVSIGNVVLNNISVDRSHIEFLNAGTITSVDAAITSLRDTGATEFAEAVKQLTESVAESTAATREVKNQLLDLLSSLSEEAVRPADRRRGGSTRAMLNEIATLMGGVAGLNDLWGQYGPTITRLFG